MPNENDSHTRLTGECTYLGSIAADLRVLVMAQCPGCHGTGPCLVRQAIRTLAGTYSTHDADVVSIKSTGMIQ